MVHKKYAPLRLARGLRESTCHFVRWPGHEPSAAPPPWTHLAITPRRSPTRTARKHAARARGEDEERAMRRLITRGLVWGNPTPRRAKASKERSTALRADSIWNCTPGGAHAREGAARSSPVRPGRPQWPRLLLGAAIARLRCAGRAGFPPPPPPFEVRLCGARLTPAPRKRAALKHPTAWLRLLGADSAPPGLAPAADAGGSGSTGRTACAFVLLRAGYRRWVVRGVGRAQLKQRQVIVFTSLALGGSRHLQSSALVGQVVRAALAAGCQLSVGCCVGADQQVIAAALAVSGGAARLSVFAQFAGVWRAVGACSVSAVAAVRAAVEAGASVQFLAGGSLAVPLAGRLIQRSQAVVQSARALVLFAPGQGSLAVAAFAVSVGRPVFAFGTGAPIAIPGAGGRWVTSSLFGLPCWSWQASQLNLF